MKCFILGGHGKLGRLIEKNLTGEENITTTLIGRAETVGMKNQAWVHSIEPGDIVVNCAALLGTNACESNRRQAVADNSNLSYSICNGMPRMAKHIYVSTEAVFGANKVGTLPRESDSPVPLNWYSVTKRLGELASLSLGGRVIRLPLLVDFDDPDTLFGRLSREIEHSRQVRLARNVFSTPLTYSAASVAIASMIRDIERYPVVVHLSGDKYLSVSGIFDLYLKREGLGNGLVEYFDVSSDSLNLINGGLSSCVFEPLSFSID